MEAPGSLYGRIRDAREKRLNAIQGANHIGPRGFARSAHKGPYKWPGAGPGFSARSLCTAFVAKWDSENAIPRQEACPIVTEDATKVSIDFVIALKCLVAEVKQKRIFTEKSGEVLLVSRVKVIIDHQRVVHHQAMLTVKNVFPNACTEYVFYPVPFRRLLYLPDCA